MKLHISFDMHDLEKALAIAQQVEKYAIRLEIGSLLIYHHGITAVKAFRDAFPDKELSVDIKIVDRGEESIKIFADAGADWISVMAGTTKDIIHAACTMAHNLNKKIMLDLLDTDSYGQSALEAQSLGADALLFPTIYHEEELPVLLDKWSMVKGNTSLPVYISGKINQELINKISEIKPDAIIVGRAITNAQDPEMVAQDFLDKLGSAEPQEE